MPILRAVIDGDKCLKEDYCPPMEQCPTGAILDDEGFRFVTNDCRGCKKCVILCTHRAISLI